MKLISLSEIIDSMPLLFVFLGLIALTSSRDEHYQYRINIQKYLRKLYFGFIKNDSVPLITFLTAMQFNIMLPISIFIRLRYSTLSLEELLIRFLFIPWFFVGSAVALLEIVSYLIMQKRVKEKKKSTEQRYIKSKKNNKHSR